MTQTVLLTGFGPYLQFDSNLSGKIARELNGKRIRGVRIIGIELPSKHKLAANRLREIVAKERPGIILGTGLGVKGFVSLERVAINNFYIMDGEKEQDEPVLKGSKMAYHSKLPLRKIRNALHKEGIPAEYSFFAGTYLCNEAFYETMKLAEEMGIKKAGFVHLPLSHRQAIRMKKQELPSMDEKIIEKAVRTIIATTVLSHEPSKK